MAKSDDIRIVRYKDELTWRDLFDDSFLSSKGMGRVLRSLSAEERPAKLNFLY